MPNPFFERMQKQRQTTRELKVKVKTLERKLSSITSFDCCRDAERVHRMDRKVAELEAAARVILDQIFKLDVAGELPPEIDGSMIDSLRAALEDE